MKLARGLQKKSNIQTIKLEVKKRIKSQQTMKNVWPEIEASGVF